MAAVGEVTTGSFVERHLTKIGLGKKSRYGEKQVAGMGTEAPVISSDSSLKSSNWHSDTRKWPVATEYNVP